MKFLFEISRLRDSLISRLSLSSRQQRSGDAGVDAAALFGKLVVFRQSKKFVPHKRSTQRHVVSRTRRPTRRSHSVGVRFSQLLGRVVPFHAQHSTAHMPRSDRVRARRIRTFDSFANAHSQIKRVQIRSTRHAKLAQSETIEHQR